MASGARRKISRLPLAACSSVRNPATPMSLGSHLPGENSKVSAPKPQVAAAVQNATKLRSNAASAGSGCQPSQSMDGPQVIEFHGAATQPRALLSGGLFNVLGIDGGDLCFAPSRRCNAVHQSNADRRMSGPIESRFRLDCFIAPDPLRCNNWHCAMTIRSR
jgi:hypothetical protein